MRKTEGNGRREIINYNTSKYSPKCQAPQWFGKDEEWTWTRARQLCTLLRDRGTIDSMYRVTYIILIMQCIPGPEKQRLNMYI